MGTADVIDRHVEAVEGEPIRWGRDDCAMWVAGVLRELHGVDMGKGWRRRYRSAAGASRALADTTLLKAVARATRAAGWARIAPDYAEPGALGMFTTTHNGLACAVCLRGGESPWWVGRVEGGVAYIAQVPTYAWRAPTAGGRTCRP